MCCNIKCILVVYLICIIAARIGLICLFGSIEKQGLYVYYNPLRNQLSVAVDGFFACYHAYKVEADFNNMLCLDIFNMIMPFTVKMTGGAAC